MCKVARLTSSCGVQGSICRHLFVVQLSTYCIKSCQLICVLLRRVWTTNISKMRTKGQVGVVTKCPDSLTLFNNTARTGSRQACTTSSQTGYALSKVQASLASQVSLQVGKTALQSEALYKQHALYLNLASQLIQKEAFMGMVKGYQEHNSQAS